MASRTRRARLSAGNRKKVGAGMRPTSHMTDRSHGRQPKSSRPAWPPWGRKDVELSPVGAARYGGARRLRLLELWPEALEPLGLDQLLIEGDRLVVESEQGRLV